MAQKDGSSFARSAMRAYVIYAHLAEHERHPALRTLLHDIAETYREQFDFWGRKSGVRGGEVAVSSVALALCRMVRAVAGVSFLARHIAGRKERRIADYTAYCATCAGSEDRRAIEAFMARLQALASRADIVARGR